MAEKTAKDRKATKALAICSGAHVIHDGVSDILYVLLPALAKFFGLTDAEVGLIRSAQRAAMSLFQIPVGIWAERIKLTRLRNDPRRGVLDRRRPSTRLHPFIADHICFRYWHGRTTSSCCCHRFTSLPRSRPARRHRPL